MTAAVGRPVRALFENPFHHLSVLAGVHSAPNAAECWLTCVACCGKHARHPGILISRLFWGLPLAACSAIIAILCCLRAHLRADPRGDMPRHRDPSRRASDRNLLTPPQPIRNRDRLPEVSTDWASGPQHVRPSPATTQLTDGMSSVSAAQTTIDPCQHCGPFPWPRPSSKRDSARGGSDVAVLWVAGVPIFEVCEAATTPDAAPDRLHRCHFSCTDDGAIAVRYGSPGGQVVGNPLPPRDSLEFLLVPGSRPHVAKRHSGVTLLYGIKTYRHSVNARRLS